jgi:hypothetical protein
VSGSGRRATTAHTCVGGDRCRHCHTKSETIEHAISACEYLAPRAYLQRHNATLKPLVWALLHKYGVHSELRPWNDVREPERVVENERIKVWWDVPVEAVHTGRALGGNRPDLRVLLKREKRLVVVEMSCPLDANVPAKVAEKQGKYGDVLDELRTQFADEATSVEYVVLVIGALGRVDKGSLLEGLEKLLAKRGKGEREGEVERVAEKMQKAVISGSIHIAKSYFRRPARRG